MMPLVIESSCPETGEYREGRAQDYSDLSDTDHGVNKSPKCFLRSLAKDNHFKKKAKARKSRKQSLPDPVMTTSQSEADEPIMVQSADTEMWTFAENRLQQKKTNSSTSAVLRRSPRKRPTRLPQGVSEISDSHSSSSEGIIQILRNHHHNVRKCVSHFT